MATDLVVALGRATVNSTTLFGADHWGRPQQRQSLQLIAAGDHPPDEHVRAMYIRLPQARHTYRVLGHRSGEAWGFTHGVNENQVAVGVTGWHSRLPAVGGGLCGTDLARLALERSHSALHALDVIADLIGRHGQCPEGGTPAPADNLFLVADRQEAFVLEAAGRHWAVLECKQVRAVTDVALIRQDWHRLAPGLSAQAIDNGWWFGDGSKLDFAGCLDAQALAHAPARRRWGRATLALEQQNGAIDAPFLRRLLFDHYETSAATRTHRPPAPLAASFMTALAEPDEPVLAWCSFGVPQSSVYFPVWLDGDLPAALQGPAADGIDVWQQTQNLLRVADECLERLQTVFEQDVETFLPQARVCKRQGDHVRLSNQATALMQKHIVLFGTECQAGQGGPRRATAPVPSEDFALYIS
jgi:hypothetical protein